VTRYVCANPACPDALRGRPRFLFEGRLGPGSEVPVRCPTCRAVTTVAVDAAGGLEVRCRPGPAA
jgi:hypothetical protein